MRLGGGAKGWTNKLSLSVYDYLILKYIISLFRDRYVCRIVGAQAENTADAFASMALHKFYKVNHLFHLY